MSDVTKRREASRLRMQKMRATRVTPLEDVTPDVTLSDPWEHVKEFISEPVTSWVVGGDMTRLERMQRIAGSLGKRAHGVWFGDLTVEDIGKVIGVKEAMY